MLLCIIAMPAWSVLTERNLQRTLGVLHLELEQNYKKQKSMMARYEVMSQQQHQQLVDYMQKSEQIGLMLYSQKTDFTFDVAYACQQASNLYKSLNKNNMPYKQVKERILAEVARYDSLIFSLKCLPPAIDGANAQLSSFDKDVLKLNSDTLLLSNDDAYQLDEAEQADRERCLVYAKAIRNNLVRFLTTLSRDNRHYEEVSAKVERLNEYAQQRYKDLQRSIYQDGGRNYLTILATLPMQWKLMLSDFDSKYLPLDGRSANYSEWRGPIVLSVSIFMLFYIIVSIIVSTFIMRGLPWIIQHVSPKLYNKCSDFIHRRNVDKAEIKRKRNLINVALGILLFAIAISIIRQFLYRNLFIMASQLMINLAWLLEAILVSLLIRLKGKQVACTVKLYLPFITMAFIVILFRIVLIPNSLVNILFPPMSLAFVIWQIHYGGKYKDSLPLSDSLYSSISLLAMIIACIMSWLGYTMMAVQVMIWWTFQLAAIQTITCIYDLTKLYEDKVIIRRVANITGQKNKTDKKFLKRLHNGDFYTKTWLYDFVRIAFIPVISIVSVLTCIYLSAEVFEMTPIVKEVFITNFINQPGVVKISLYKLCLVGSLYFIFRYINYSIRSYYHYWYRKANKGEGNFNETLTRNITAIIVWGAFFIFAMVLLQVPKTGISVVAAGLATGMGFATKDLLENFFYGISLMTGRVRVGDWIECDGTLGKVDSITYQSTQIVTADGSVIAFLNSALFSKNFKNLTRNHGYVLNNITVGVAYGTDVEKVKSLIVEGLQPLRNIVIDGHHMLQPEHEITVKFADFGASSVDLNVYAWVWVPDKATYLPMAREIIYNVLNKHHIEIPFPQQDIYIRQIATPTTSNETKDA